MTENLSTTDFVIHFGVVTWIVHEVLWCTLVTPYLLIEKYRLFQDKKLQKNFQNSYQEFKNAFKQQLKEQVVVLLPILMFVSTLQTTRKLFVMYWEELPSFKHGFVQVALMRITQELIFYIVHRFLHTPWAYQKIHKVHHDHLAPWALTGEHAHPIESLIGNTGPFILGVCAVGFSPLGPIHQVVLYAFLFYTLLRATEAHCGYILPWHVDNYRIFGWLNGGSVHHDGHHLGFNYNFGEKWIDKIFGTDERAYRKKKQA
eukprot:CAMPEP_0168544466 /NCGR_PEP_ID=MMETSP0413-20121227/2435_1 /TAXON_ID=136452 /ORGANISM="Filamoeba nolandi, Strain NC-AS-23-1" /LENGTH=258 /DNA_ID=CAMNT_0008574489 /DNA_START=48 /DNA_END=820 /DNA_ORIENTATION=+